MDDQYFDEWSFTVGYDDLTDIDPLGNEVVLRYGKHWNLQCRVMLEDTLTVNPLVDGIHVEEVHTESTTLPFKLSIFSDDTFQTVKSN